MNWNPQSKQRAEDLRKLAAGESLSNTPHTEAAGGTGDNASSTLPPTAPIALPVRAGAEIKPFDQQTISYIASEVSHDLRCADKPEDGMDRVRWNNRCVAGLLTHTAALSRELEEAKAERDEARYKYDAREADFQTLMREREDAINAALRAAPRSEGALKRLCSYCKTWNSKPCGEQCYMQANDPTWEQVNASAALNSAAALAHEPEAGK